MRNERTGRMIYFQPDPNAPRTNADPGFSYTPYAPSPKQAPARMKVVGVGDSGITDLGEEDMRALPVDFTRPGIEIPGLGKGRYTADGRSAVIDNPDGSKTKVLLGYDAGASDRRNDRALKLDMARANLEQTREQTGALRDKRAMMAEAANAPPATDSIGGGIVPQAALEKVYGKPDAGHRWTQDGKLEPLPGGKVEQEAKTTLEKAQDAISQIDAMIGKRDEQGRVVEGKPHPGFKAAVGVGFGKTFGSLSDSYPFPTDGRDFSKRLEQLKGGAFLEAFETLKGGGQITEVEGKKATAAITRMDTAQSEPEFIQAATEFRNILSRGLARAKLKAPSVGGGGSSGPNPGTVDGDYFFKGGNPSDPNNWVKRK